MSTSATTNNPQEVESISFWKVFVTQSDWSSRATLETWYGHHKPLRRMLWFLHLAAICSSAAMFWELRQSVPFLQPMKQSQLDEIQSLHIECLDSICEAVQDLEWLCEVNPSGKTAHVISMGTGDIETVAFPPSCHEAYDRTVGQNFLSEGVTGVDMISLTEQAVGSRRPLFHLVRQECRLRDGFLQLFLPESDGHFPIQNLAAEVDYTNLKPGDTQMIRLADYACFTELSIKDGHSPKTVLRRHQVRKKLSTSYSWVLYFRHSITLCVLYWQNLMTEGFIWLGDVPIVVLLSLILRWLVSWPKTTIGGKTISFWTTLRTMLLLATISAQRHGSWEDVLLATILSGSAFAYNNHKAATEWAFFGFLWYIDMHSLHHMVQDWITSSTSTGFLDLLSQAGMVLDVIPGYGLWKLVTAYVIYMSFPRMATLRQKLD